MNSGPNGAAAPMLTKADLAKKLRLTPRSIERRMRSGGSAIPPFFRCGKQALWNAAAVDEWERRNTFTSLAHERATQCSNGGPKKNDT